MEKYMLPCINKMIFGIDCLGCGAQRSFLLVLQGDFQAAFVMYPAIYTILLLLLFLCYSRFWKTRHDLKIKLSLISLNALIVMVSYGYKMQYLLESI